jgi:hypothetical protein
MAAMVRTEATMERWVMKVVTRQNTTPNIQSLSIGGLSCNCSLVLHENVVEDTVEDGVDQVGEAEVED